MLRGREVGAITALVLVTLWAGSAAADQTIGGACSGTVSSSSQSSNGNNVVCIGSVWQYPAYQFGNSSLTCNGTNGGIIRWTGAAFQGCDGSNWAALGGGSSTYDLAMFYPGTIGASALVRIVSARAATYSTNLSGSYCVAKEGATSSTTVNLNQIHAGSSTNVGTVVFGSGGGTNVTNCTFNAASGISLAAGDALEFAFPATPDATLGDVAITLAGTH